MNGGISCCQRYIISTIFMYSTYQGKFSKLGKPSQLFMLSINTQARLCLDVFYILKFIFLYQIYTQLCKILFSLAYLCLAIIWSVHFVVQQSFLSSMENQAVLFFVYIFLEDWKSVFYDFSSFIYIHKWKLSPPQVTRKMLYSSMQFVISFCEMSLHVDGSTSA